MRNAGGAQACKQEAEEAEKLALEALTAAGADQATLIHERIKQAQGDQAAIEARRVAMTARLQAFDQVLPCSSGDLELLRAALTQLRAGLAAHHDQLSEGYEAQAGEKARLAAAFTGLKAELEQVLKQAGNIPHDADQRRRLIAEGARIPAGRLQYIGELLDIPPEHLGWGRAILTIIRPLASDLLVAAQDFPAVRAWVNSHNLGGDITLVPGVAHRPVRTHQAGTVAAMLDITAGPCQGWLSEELARFTYLCVEKDTDLEGPRLAGVVGRVTRAGMRTAPNRRVIKADAPRRYRWAGRDNSALRAELEDELDGLRRQFDDATRRVEIARGTAEAEQDRIGDLDRLQKELSWTDLDLEPTTRRLASLADALDQADTPEQQGRRNAYTVARKQVTDAESVAAKCRECVERLNLLWGAAQRAQDTANDLIDAHEPLTGDELAAAAALPFAAPALDRVDLSGRDVDARTDAAVQASYTEAARILEDQITAHDAARASHERTLLAIIRAYRNINDRTRREVDDAIESLPALEQIVVRCGENFLYVFKGTPSARQAVRHWPSSDAGMRAHRGIARSGVKTMPEPGAVAGNSPTSGRRPPAPCRAREPSGRGAATRSARPHPQAGSPRRNAPPMTATARTGRAVRLAPGILSPRKDHRLGRPRARPCGVAQAPP